MIRLLGWARCRTVQEGTRPRHAKHAHAHTHLSVRSGLSHPRPLQATARTGHEGLRGCRWRRRQGCWILRP
eukprot:4692003-Alexandrium_andersonii.AAC.1